MTYRERRFIVAEDFFDDPDAVRDAALALDYYRPRGLTGLRSRVAVYPRNTRSRLEAIIGCRIRNWRDDPEIGHGIFYKAFSGGPHKEIPGVHYDEPLDRLTALIQLTPGLPVSCGTSFWMHKPTGLSEVPSSEDAKYLGLRLRQLKGLLERDAENPAQWVEVARVGHRYNRLLCFPSRALHSATKHHGATDRNVRLYQTFRLRIH